MGYAVANQNIIPLPAAVGKIAPTVDLSADVASRGGFRLEVEVDFDVLADERSTDLGLM
jgi:hypothetical protein